MKKLALLIILFIAFYSTVTFAAEDSLKEIVYSDDRSVIWEDEAFRKQIKGVIGTGFLYSLDYSRDGRYLLVTSSFGLEVYDSKYKLVKRIFTKDLVKDATFSPDGKLIASISREELKLWDLSKGKVILTSKNTMIPRQVAFSKDGEYIAYCGYRFDVQLIHRKTGAIEKILKHGNFISAIAFHPTKALLISGGRDKTIRTFSLKNREEQLLLRAKGEITSLAISPDGTYLFYATRDKILNILNLNTRRQRSLRIKLSSLQAMTISPDNKYLAAYTKNNTFFLWNLKTNKLAKMIKPGVKRPPRYLNNETVAFHKTGKKLAYINEKNQVVILSVPDGKVIKTIDHSAFGAFSTSMDGKFLVGTPSRFLANKSKLINLKKSTVRPIKSNFTAYTSAFHPESKMFILGGKGKIAYYHTDNFEKEFSIVDRRIGFPYSLSISPRSDLAAISTTKNNVIILNLKDEEITKIIRLSNPVFTLSFDSTGSKLLAGHNDLVVYDLKNGTRKTLYSYIGGTHSLAASLTRNWVVLGDLRKILHLVNIDNGEVRSKKKNSFGKTPVAFSLKGRYVVFGGYQSVGVWDTFKDKMIDFKGYKDFIETVAFSRDRKYIYSLGREDGLIIITKTGN